MPAADYGIGLPHFGVVRALPAGTAVQARELIGLAPRPSVSGDA